MVVGASTHNHKQNTPRKNCYGFAGDGVLVALDPGVGV